MGAMVTVAPGGLRKMLVEPADPVRYTLVLGEERVLLNDWLGRRISLDFHGVIHCVHCGRKTSKSFNQGYCYPCFRKLAACDTCIVSPERCHYDQGTCREPEWGEAFCHQPHIVYLANSSGLKVGITRRTQLPTRWLDQGATQALPILAVATRQQAGLVEVAIKQHAADRTNWRAMLRGTAEPVDLIAERERLLAACKPELDALHSRFGLQAIQPLEDAEAVTFAYPVLEYPTKITSLDFGKQPRIEGTLLGIKGQYLMLDSGVINLRKFSAYQVSFSGAGTAAPEQAPAGQAELTLE
jgi:hypothetical protein